MAVPVTKGKYASNETQIYAYLTGTMKLSKAAACGVLANIQHESSFNHQALGDNGTSYGLCQWHDTRWTRLRKYCSDNKLNPTTVAGQLSYLNYELSTFYKSVLNVLKSVSNNAQGSYDAAYEWCYNFEIPADKGSRSIQRGNLAKNTYWKAYSESSTTTTTATNKGNLIVLEARKHLGKPYVWGAEGPSSFDCSGFTYYVYKKAINYNWSRTTAYMQFSKYGRTVSDMKAGDLVFFKDTYATGNNPNISHVGIATGVGTEFIQASSSDGVVVSNLESKYYKSHYHSTKRLIADSETPSTTPSGTSNSDVNASVSDTKISPAVSVIGGLAANMLQSAADELIRTLVDKLVGNLGYLLDLTNGGEFKFYVPEFGISISPSWEDINILGRSAGVKGYNNTQSRSIDVELDLFAGAGMYSLRKSLTDDRADDMLNDIHFVESLAYPDYSKALVSPPPKVLLYLGPTVQMKGVITNVRVNYMKPYTVTSKPMRARLQFTVVHVTDTPPDFNDVRSNSFEGKRSISTVKKATTPQPNTATPTTATTKP